MKTDTFLKTAVSAVALFLFLSRPVPIGSADSPPPATAGKEVELRLEPLPSRGVCRVFLKINEVELQEKYREALIELFPVGSSQPVQSSRLTDLKDGTGYCKLEIGSLQPGSYQVSATLVGKAGPANRVSLPLVKPEEPWRGTKVGVTDQVLPPWTPIKVVDRSGDKSDLTVSVWGRDYTFREAALPNQITTRNKDILAEPIRWQTVVDGKPVVWKYLFTKIEEQTPGRVTIRVLQESDKFSLETKTRIEYDGLVWCESKFTPKGEAVGAKIDSLELLMPLKEEYAGYRFIYNNRPDSGANNVPEGSEYRPEQSKFRFLWIGDQERGLNWFYADPSQFNYGNPNYVLGIRHTGQTMTAGIRFISQTSTISKPLKLAFGLIATPNRPLPNGWRMWGTQRYIGTNWSIPWTEEAWTSYGGGYPESNNPEFYQSMIDSLHRRGIKTVPYVLLGWRDINSPEWQYNKAEWEIPGGSSSYSDKRKFWFGNVTCAESESYRDFLCYMVKKFVDDYNLDGLYHDIQSPGLCANENHGCSGGRRGVLGSRELNRRVYGILHSYPRPMIKIDHLSGEWWDPVASFCDAVVIGEEMCADGMDLRYAGPYRVVDDYFKVTNIQDYLIASGVVAGQRGPIPWFLPEMQVHTPDVTRGMLALLLPNDAAWTIWNGRNDMKEMHKIWRAAKDFQLGADDVVFTGYWSQELPVSASFAADGPPTLLSGKPVVSVWNREKNGVLLVVANYSTTEDGVAELSLDLAKLKLKGPVEVADGEEPLVWYPSNGKLLVPVRKENFRLVRVRPGKTAADVVPKIAETAEGHLAGYLPESSKQGKGDIEVGRIAEKGSTRYGQVITITRPISVTHLEAHISFGGKLMDDHNATVKEGDLWYDTCREPQVKIVEVDESGLPMENKTVVSNGWITYSEFRPGEDIGSRTFFFDRVVELPAGKYAVIFFKEPEGPGKSYTYSLAGYRPDLSPGNYGVFFDGEKWLKSDKIAACGLFGPVTR